MSVKKKSKTVIIQKRIDEVMTQEFEKMILKTSNDPLIQLIRKNELRKMSIDEIKDYLKGDKK